MDGQGQGNVTSHSLSQSAARFVDGQRQYEDKGQGYVASEARLGHGRFIGGSYTTIGTHLLLAVGV